MLKTCKKLNKDEEVSTPNESQSCFCHMTNFGTMDGFTHKRFKRISNSTGPSHQLETLALSLQVAAQ